MKNQSSINIEQSKIRMYCDSWTLLSTTVHLMNKSLEKQVQKVGLTLSQALILWLVRSKKDATIAGLARFFRHETHSVSQLIDRMEKQGLVQREKGNKAGRIIKLTNKGEQTFKQTNLIENICMLMSVLTDDDCAQLNSLMRMLQRSAATSLAKEIAQSIASEYEDVLTFKTTERSDARDAANRGSK